MEFQQNFQVQEIETQAARQNMEQGYQKDELKRLKQQLADLRNKLADLEGRVSHKKLINLGKQFRTQCSRSKSKS